MWYANVIVPFYTGSIVYLQAYIGRTAKSRSVKNVNMLPFSVKADEEMSQALFFFLKIDVPKPLVKIFFTAVCMQVLESWQTTASTNSKEGSTNSFNYFISYLETNLFSSIRDAVSQWIDAHSNVQVGVAEPLNCFIDIGYCAKSNLMIKATTTTLNHNSSQSPTRDLILSSDEQIFS